MPRHGSSHLSWLEPASSGGLSPMQLLVAWLSRHYAAFTRSNTKVEMLEQPCHGMRDSGFPGCTIHAIRSKIDSLGREARQERMGYRRHSQAFQQFQHSLMAIFEGEDAATREMNDTSDTETSDEDVQVDADNEEDEEPEVKTEPAVQDGSRNASFRVEHDDEGEGRGVRATFIAEESWQRTVEARDFLDVTEIRRRFELLCARHGLQQQGVAMELIDRILPLPEE